MVSIKCVRVLNTALLLQVALGTLIKAQSSSSPQFTTQPQNITVPSNRRATLQCSANGTPQPTITWFKDDTNVTIDSRRSVDSNGYLLIENPQASDEGTYHCVANNTAGSVQSRRGSLRIAVFSTINSSPLENHLVSRYTSLVLNCALPSQSVPYPPMITWPSVTSQLMDSGRVTVTLNGSLVFTSYFQQTDGSTFECRVTNPVLGTTQQSSSYLLTENGLVGNLVQTTQIVVPPAPLQTAVVGDSVSFECFTTGRPIASIRWLKDGSPVGTSATTTTSQSGRILTISSVVASDAGSYTCEANQTISSGINTETASGRLEVIVPPRITSSFSQTTVNVTLPVSLTCQSEGTAPLQWTWKRDTQTLSNDGVISFTTSGAESTLTISPVSLSDGGVYQCVVEQPSTGRTAAANELLLAKAIRPEFTHGQSLTDQLVLEASSILLPCTALGFPPPEFKWRIFRSNVPQLLDINSLSRYSKPPSGTGNGSLIITNAQQGDSGTLDCTAENKAGNVTTPAIQLFVIAPPIRVQTPDEMILVTAGETVILPCSVQVSRSDITRTYRWSKDDQVIATGTTGTYSIQDFQETNNGVYKCDVLISIGSINAPPIVYPVATSVVSVGEPMPPSSPSSPEATMITATSFTANWDPPSFNGRLPLSNYTVELQRFETPFCPGDLTFRPVLTGIEPDSTSMTVQSLYPSVQYQFRVIAFNFLYRSTPSTISDAIQTLSSAPIAPPTNVRVESSESSAELTIRWEDPPSCTQGGELTGYSIQYRIQPSTLFMEETTPQGSNEFVLSNLSPATTYEVRVAARNSNGAGVYSESMSTTTAEFIDVTTVESSTQPSSSNVTVPETQPTSVLFYKQIWFYTVMAVIGLLIIIIIIVAFVICCIVCWKCGSGGGKIFNTGRRSGSSLSGASSNFSEYQRKNKVLSKIVKVHESPTPSRRSTDYADLEAIHPAPSTIGTISLNYTDSIVSEQVNGRVHSHFQHHGKHYPVGGGDQFIQGGHHRNQYPHSGAPNPRFETESPEGIDYPVNDMDMQPHHMRGESMSSRFVDTLTRVHTPPPARRESPEHHMMSSPPRMSSPHDFDSQTEYSQDDSETWNPSNHLNYKGHMSNKPVSRSNSGRSTQSSKSFESGRGHPSNIQHDPHQHKRRQQLSPLHENQFPNKRDPLRNQHIQAQAMSVQELHGRSHTVSNQALQHTTDDHAMRMQRAQSMDQNFGMKMKSRQPPIGMEMKQLPSVATEKHHMREVPQFTRNEHKQQFISPPPPDYEQNYNHEAHLQRQSTSPVPNPHVVEYGLSPPVHLSFSHSIEQQGHPQPMHNKRGQRPVNYHPANKYPMHKSNSPSPEHFPTSDQMLDQPQSMAPPHQRHPADSHSKRPLNYPQIQFKTQNEDKQTYLSTSEVTPAVSRPQRHLNYPQIQIKTQNKDGQTYLSTSEVTPVKNYPPNRTTSPIPSNQPTTTNRTSSPVYSVPLNVSKKNVQEPASPPPPIPTEPPPLGQQEQQQQQLNMLYIDQSFINNPGDSLDSGVGHSIDRKQVKTHPPRPPPHQGSNAAIGNVNSTRQQSVPALTHNLSQQRQISEPAMPMYATPKKRPVGNTDLDISTSSQFNGFERVPMSSSQSMDTLGSSSQQTGWDSDIDRIQQQFQLSVQNMQTLTAPIVENGYQSPPNSSAAHVHQDAQKQFTSTINSTKPPTAPKPVVAPKPPVAPKPQPSKLLKSNSKSNTKLNGPEFDPNSLAINKLRPSIPDLGQLTDMDPKKPKIKQGKVRRAVWEPRPMNRAIESSSDSDSDTSSEYSVDSVLQPGDNTSLRSSHV